MNNKNALNLISETRNNNYIIFDLNEKKCAINLKNVVEIINLPEIEFLDTAPVGIVGVFKYNDKIINIIDLNTLLNIPVTNFSINNQLIIISAGKENFAVITDSVTNITKIEDEQLQNIPFESSFNIISQIIKDNDETINIIDIEKAFKQIQNNFQTQNNINYKALYPSDEKSKQILSIRADKSDLTPNLFNFPIKESSVKQYVMFTLGNQNYYLDLKCVKEFVSLKRIMITPLPYTQDFIKGIINIKGDYIVVVDLKRFLRNDINEIKPTSKLIIVDGKNFNIAFMVDDVKYIKTLNDVQEYNQNIMHNSEYTLAEFTQEDKLYTILNFEKIINDEKLYINVG